MTGKASVVFWIGLTLVLLNLWVSRQSAIFWQLFSKKNNMSNSNSNSNSNPNNPNNWKKDLGQAGHG
jgi:hypothetical protein